MSLFFYTAAELRVSVSDMERLPDDRLASEIFMKVYEHFASSVGEFIRLPKNITPEMLEACFVRTFGKEVMKPVSIELRRLSTEAYRWFEKGGTREDYAQTFYEQLPLLRRTATMAIYGHSSTKNPATIALLAFSILQTRQNCDRFMYHVSLRCKENTLIAVEV